MVLTRDSPPNRASTRRVEKSTYLASTIISLRNSKITSYEVILRLSDPHSILIILVGTNQHS
jgi:hypothetical protein